MADLIDLAKARRARAHWGGLVVLKPEGADVTAEMVDFWGDDLRQPPTRLRMWATALEDLARQMRQTADAIAPPPTEGGEQYNSSRSRPCADAGPCPRSPWLLIETAIPAEHHSILVKTDAKPPVVGEAWWRRENEKADLDLWWANEGPGDYYSDPIRLGSGQVTHWMPMPDADDGGEAVHTGQLREEPKDDSDPTEGGV